MAQPCPRLLPPPPLDPRSQAPNPTQKPPWISPIPVPPPPPLRVCPHIHPIRPRKQQIGDLLWRPHPRTPNPAFAKPPRANASSTRVEPRLREIPTHLRQIGDIRNLHDLLWRLRDIRTNNAASSASASFVGCRSASLVVVRCTGRAHAACCWASSQ
jgi:hypothetical protein